MKNNELYTLMYKLFEVIDSTIKEEAIRTKSTRISASHLRKKLKYIRAKVFKDVRRKANSNTGTTTSTVSNKS